MNFLLYKLSKLVPVLLACFIFNSSWAIPPMEQEMIQVTVLGKGKPMLLIPGLNSHPSVWNETVDRYKGDFECHVIHLAGFAGLPAADFGDAYLPKVKTAILKYIEEKELEKPVIMGHSLGAFLAMWISSEIPDNIGAAIMVDGLPFMPALQMPGATPENVQATAEQVRTGIKAQTPESIRATAPQYLAPMVTGNEKLEVLIDWGIQSDAPTSGQAMYELMTIDLRGKLDKITSPSMVLGAWIGYKDFGVTREMTMNGFKQQFQNLANHELYLSDKGKHFIMWDDPAFFFDRIDQFFLKISEKKDQAGN